MVYIFLLGTLGVIISLIWFVLTLIKKKDKKKPKMFLISSLILTVIGVFSIGTDSASESKSNNSSSSSEIIENKSSISSTQTSYNRYEETSQPTSKTRESSVADQQKDNYDEVNSLIKEHLTDSQGWATGKLDGDGNPTENGTPDENQAWALYVHDLKYTGDEIAVYTDAGFSDLPNAEKDSIANTCQSVVSAYLGPEENWEPEDYRKGLFLTVYNGEDPLGHSKVLNMKEYKWY